MNGGMNGGAIRAAVTDFQTDLDRVTNEQPPFLLRATSLVMAGGMMGVIAIAAFTRVDMVVTGHGRLAADHPTMMLQPMDRGMIRTVLVRAGDRVAKGQIVATLDPTFAHSDFVAMDAQEKSLAAEIARLAAEASGTEFIPASATPEFAIQTKIFDQRRREYAARLASFDQAIAHDAAEMATARGQHASLQRQVEIATQVRNLRETLLRGAVGSRLQFLEADQALTQASGNLHTAADRLQELAHATLSHQADRRSFIENWRRDILENLDARQRALSQVKAALIKAARTQDLVNVTAPEDGVVLEMAQRAPGSVLNGAEPLLTLLPVHAGLVAEITIRSADIGFLHAGDPVVIKIDAYPFQQHGTLSGHVRNIAAASFDQMAQDTGDLSSGGAMHRVSVTLDGGELQGLPPGVGPIPGMTLSADVRVGTRSVLAYFLAPITRGFTNSFRER